MRAMLTDEQAGQSVVLVGGRRCGKTRTMERLAAYLQSLANKETPLAAEDDLMAAWDHAVPDHRDSAPFQPQVRPHWPVPVNFQGRGPDGLEAAGRGGPGG